MSRTNDPDRERIAAMLGDGDEYEVPQRWLDLLRAANERRGAWYESPSSIVNYLQCPGRWLSERYLDLPGSASHWKAVTGVLVHRVFEVLYSEPEHLRTNKLKYELMDDLWDDLLDGVLSGVCDHKCRDDFDALMAEAEIQVPVPEDTDSELLNDMRALLVHCVKSIYDFDGSPNTVQVVKNEFPIRLQRNNIVIRGIIDRIIREDDTGEVVQDYKSGKVPWSKGNKKPDVLDIDYVPCGIYALARSSGRPGVRPRPVNRVDLLYVAHDKPVHIDITERELARTSLLVDMVTADMRKVLDTGRIRIRSQASAEKFPCKFCPLYRDCAAYNDTGDFQATDLVVQAVRDKALAATA